MAMKRACYVILIFISLAALDIYRTQARSYSIEDPVTFAYWRGVQNLNCSDTNDSTLLYICALGRATHNIRMNLNSLGYIPLHSRHWFTKSTWSEALGFVLGERSLDPGPFFKIEDLDLNYTVFAQGYGSARLITAGYSASLSDCRRHMPSEWISSCIFGMGRASVDQIQTWYQSRSFPVEFINGNALHRREKDRLRLQKKVSR